MAENTSASKTDIASVLKNEISRLAKKQIRAELEPYKLAAARSKEQIAALRADVAALTKVVTRMRKQINKAAPPAQRAVDNHADSTRQRFTAKGFASLRTRLGLTHFEMGQLIGASDQSIRKWEEGAATPRAQFQQAIFALRGIGKKEAVARLRGQAI